MDSGAAPQTLSAESQADLTAQAVNPAAPATEAGAITSEAPRAQPQLIKTAELRLTVDSVEQSLKKITAIAQQQQGDVLTLQDQTPPDDYSRHTAFMQLRVPQAKLADTLDALAEVGTVQQQAIAAEDVSNQLVDFQSRLRNLRKTEETLLQIMDRSGDVGDVLKVAQELSNVRNSIEQIDAQLKDLQNRVAYSSISLNLEEAIASNRPQRSTGTQVRETWDNATHSLGEFTVDLLQLGIWLLVYSPYWLLMTVAIGLGYLRFRSQKSVSDQQSDLPPSS
jgi:archaellum component FlaC